MMYNNIIDFQSGDLVINFPTYRGFKDFLYYIFFSEDFKDNFILGDGFENIRNYKYVWNINKERTCLSALYFRNDKHIIDLCSVDMFDKNIILIYK